MQDIFERVTTSIFLTSSTSSPTDDHGYLTESLDNTSPVELEIDRKAQGGIRGVRGLMRKVLTSRDFLTEITEWRKTGIYESQVFYLLSPCTIILDFRLKM